MRKYTFIETEYWSVSLNEKDQRYLGRSYVSLKRPCSSLSDLTELEIIDFLKVVKKFESIMKETFGATMFNWSCLMNNAYQEVNAHPQVHWHVRPRYEKPIELFGETFIDEEFGHHYNRQPEKNRKISEEVLVNIFSLLEKD